ncbi:MAG: hypothetical protein WC861_04155 [Candidatus Micrarchaeia archaeon]
MAIYNTLPIAGALIAIYLVSLFLSRQGKYLDVLLHRKIWNALLVTAFVLTAISAIFYLLMLDYSLDLLPRQIDVIFWHVEFGTVFVIIGACHALWHMPYFKQYLPKEKPKMAVPASPAQPAPSAPQQEKKE